MRSIRRIGWASEEQRQGFEAGPDPLLLLGGFNAAKTWTCILKLLALLDTFQNSRAAIIRATYKHLRKTTMETFYSLCPPEAYSRGRRSDQEGICQLNNGSLIHFLGLDKPESIDILAGLEINYGFIDQAEQINERVWDTLDSRLGRWAQAKIPQAMLDMHPNGWPWTSEDGEMMVPPPFLFATANPPESEDHFLFTRFADESEDRAKWKDEGYRMIRMPSTSNRYASRANLRKLQAKDEEFRHRFVEGLWSNPKGSIFTVDPMSILEPHPALVKRIIYDMRLHRSLDHGDSAPTVVLWHGTDHDGNIFVYREHYEVDLISGHRQKVWEHSKQDIPVASVYSRINYSSNIADPSIFSLSRGRTATSAPTWSVADEWLDTRIMPEETIVRWTPAPIPRSDAETYDLITRARIKEYLRVDPTHRHPITGQLGAPRLYFLKRTPEYPQGCYHVIKEVKGQRRVKIGERDGQSVYSDRRDDTIVDHAYDTVKYFVISRPAVTRVTEKKDPNVVNIRELMEQTAKSNRIRARARRVSGGY